VLTPVACRRSMRTMAIDDSARTDTIIVVPVTAT
jgi:hypothetical protein